MSQSTIDSFFTARKRNANINNKRKINSQSNEAAAGKAKPQTPVGVQETPVGSNGDSAIVKDTPTTMSTPTAVIGTPSMPTIPAAPSSTPAMVPTTLSSPTKFATPSKDLDLGVTCGVRAKRARLGDLNERLEKALQAQQERKKTDRKAAKEEKAKNALPVPFPKEKLELEAQKVIPPSSPKLSRKSILVDVVVPSPSKALLAPSSPLKRLPPLSPTKPPVSRVKASPRRWAAAQEYINMANHAQEAELKLPYKYKFLLEVFRNVEQIISMKFNRHETIRVADMKPAVQTAMKRNFTDRYLTMIRAVFPQAYRYSWEQLRSKYGQKKDDYELHMTPNLSYKENLEAGTKLSDDQFHVDVAKSSVLKLGARDLIARRQIFTGILYTMVHDQHRTFLKRQDPPLSLPDSAITAWHADFDLESCHDVDMTPLPLKPDVVRFNTVSSALSASRNLFGVNRRLEEVLKDHDEKKAEDEKEAEQQQEEAISPSKMKGLEGLPPAVVKRILAKQKAKQIKAMTEKPEEKKEIAMMEEMQTFGPLILNCLNSEKQRQSRAAVAFHPFLKFVSESHGRGKSIADTEAMVRTLLKLAPDWLQVVSVRRVEYLKNRAGAPDSNAMRAKLKQLLDDKKKV